ncbi:MAG: PLP-dependent transferase [Bacteroidia bacterium]
MCKSRELSEQIHFNQNASGGVLGPWDCFLTIRGIETLEIRYKRHCETALRVAQFLEQHDSVDKVYYPGLASRKNHIASVQQNGLFGGIVHSA